MEEEYLSLIETGFLTINGTNAGRLILHVINIDLMGIPYVDRYFHVPRGWMQRSQKFNFTLVGFTDLLSCQKFNDYRSSITKSYLASMSPY